MKIYSSFLESNNIKYIFTAAYDDLYKPSENNNINEIYERLDIENNFVHYKHKDNILFFNEYTDLKKYPRGKVADHPLEFAHQNWANVILNT